jgi:ENTS family enterobactin (siderophore) exporter
MRKRLWIDTRPLRESLEFRRLFCAQSVSMVGSQLAVVATAYQVFSLTGSSLQVGAVSLVQLLPFVAGSVGGGALADAVDRRRILVAATAMLAVLSAGMAINALADGHASVIAIYALTAPAAGLSGMVATAATAAVPSLVRPGALTASYATMQVIDQLGMVAGPAAGGFLIAGVGLPWLYGADSLTFIWAAAFLAGIGSQPRRRGVTGRRALTDGLRYLRGREALQGAYLIDLCATVFGLPRAVFPALDHSVFHGGPASLGLLYAAPAAGALAGSLTSGWLSAVRRAGRVVIYAVLVWGIAITGLGFVRSLGLALALLIVAGWVDVISAVLRSTIVQTVVHERYRSRVSGLQMAVVEGGPRLGDLQSGALASAVSAEGSVVAGGLLCIAGALALAAARPGFRRYGQASVESAGEASEQAGGSADPSSRSQNQHTEVQQQVVG